MAEKRILIVKMSAIGDVVHTIPAARAIKTAYPDSYLGWVIEDWAAPIIEGNPDIDAIFKVPKTAWKRSRSFFGKLADILALRRQLRQHRFEIAFDFQGLTKSGFAARLSGAKTRIGFGDENSREVNFLFLNKRLKVPPEKVHVVDKNLHLLTAIGIDGARAAFTLPFDDGDDRPVREFLEKRGLEEKNFAVINPGAGWITKRWENDRFGAVARYLHERRHLRSVLTWAGDKEKRMVDEIFAAAGGAAVIAPSTNLKELAALLSKAAIFIGCDTGPTHMAACFDIPVVALFGAAGAARNGPYSARAVSIQKALPCSPCWKRRDCPREVQCMKDITVREVTEAAERVLGEGT